MLGKFFQKKLSDDFSNISDLKNNLKDRDINKNQKYEKFFVIGLLHFKEFIKNNNFDNRKKAIDYLTKVIDIKKNHAESYFYLSLIAYISGDIELAKKYFNIANILNNKLNGLTPRQKS